jgi:NAD(P)-dependent dehydrogenase (short-subunit alcohol dehydrogenase family)
MDLQLNGKLTLVTGSTAGIGLAIARTLAAEGARVIINGRTQTRVDEAIASIRNDVPQAGLESFAGDLGNATECDRVAAQFPDVEILVNNLGIFEPKPFEEVPDADWYRFFETNFMSGMRLSRHYLSRMKTRDWGRIIFISSESSSDVPAEMIHYGVTKTMQISLARGLAGLTTGTGVTVNSILPGPTWSEGVEQFVKDLARDQNKPSGQVEKEFFTTMRPNSLLRRFIQTDEIASFVAYIASPRSAATNGAALRAEGGLIHSIF